jgi:hypothetical protein
MHSDVMLGFPNRLGRPIDLFPRDFEIVGATRRGLSISKPLAWYLIIGMLEGKICSSNY